MPREEFPAPAAVREALRTLATALPDNAVLPVPVRVMLSLLSPEAPDKEGDMEGADLSVIELAGLFQRATSTIRGWLQRGDIEGAYRLHGADWRVPRAAVNRFREAQQSASRPSGGKARAATGANIGKWRMLGGR